MSFISEHVTVSIESAVRSMNENPRYERYLRDDWRDQLSAYLQSLSRQPLSLKHFCILKLALTKELDYFVNNVCCAALGIRLEHFLRMVVLMGKEKFNRYKITDNTVSFQIDFADGLFSLSRESVTAHDTNFRKSCNKAINNLKQYRRKIDRIQRDLKSYHSVSTELRSISDTFLMKHCTDIKEIDACFDKESNTLPKLHRNVEFSKYERFHVVATIEEVEDEEGIFNDIYDLSSLAMLKYLLIKRLKERATKHHFKVISLILSCSLMSINPQEQSIFDIFTLEPYVWVSGAVTHIKKWKISATGDMLNVVEYFYHV